MTGPQAFRRTFVLAALLAAPLTLFLGCVDAMYDHMGHVQMKPKGDQRFYDAIAKHVDVDEDTVEMFVYLDGAVASDVARAEMQRPPQREIKLEDETIDGRVMAKLSWSATKHEFQRSWTGKGAFKIDAALLDGRTFNLRATRYSRALRDYRVVSDLIFVVGLVRH
jgi:hypothetical protein